MYHPYDPPRHLLAKALSLSFYFSVDRLRLEFFTFLVFSEQPASILFDQAIFVSIV